MKMKHDYSKLLKRTEERFELAVQDVEDEAKRNADRNARTGKFSGSITHTIGRSGDMLVARVGSPMVSARVKERGGFMQASASDTLYLPQAGEVRRPTSVRVRATPVVTPAGKKFPEFMSRRMRG